MNTILDVSRYQGMIDWDKVKASGLVDGVMLRALGNSAKDDPSKPYIDPYFARNYVECQRMGIPVGVYGYFKATTKVQASRNRPFPARLARCPGFTLVWWRRSMRQRPDPSLPGRSRSDPAP